MPEWPTALKEPVESPWQPILIWQQSFKPRGYLINHVVSSIIFPELTISSLKVPPSDVVRLSDDNPWRFGLLYDIWPLAI